MKREYLFRNFICLAVLLSLAGCAGEETETQFVYLGQNLCSFLGEDNQPLTVEVTASSPAWKVESGASWVKAERAGDGLSLVITVDDNNSDVQREAAVTVTSGEASQQIGIIQLGLDRAIARYRLLDRFAYQSAMSPSGRYVGGYSEEVVSGNDWEKTPTIIDLETGESVEFGPFPGSLYGLSETKAISDQGVLFIDNSLGGQMAFTLDGDAFEVSTPSGFRGKGTVQGTSADGKYWVGYAREAPAGEGLYQPLRWADGVPEKLPLPEKSYRGEEFTTGVMARGISANGEVIYGSTWEDPDYGMVYWKDGKVDYVGKDVRVITTVKKKDRYGNEADFNLVNGVTYPYSLTAVSPSGRYIGGSYVTESLSEDGSTLVQSEGVAAVYDTETETTVIIEEYGPSFCTHVTDDGIAFLTAGTFLVTDGYVHDIRAGISLGSTAEWMLDTYGIVIPAGYVTYVSPDGRQVFGMRQIPALPEARYVSWYVSDSAR